MLKWAGGREPRERTCLCHFTSSYTPTCRGQMEGCSELPQLQPLWINLTCKLPPPGANCLFDSLLIPLIIGSNFITSFNEAHLFFEDMSR